MIEDEFFFLHTYVQTLRVLDMCPLSVARYVVVTLVNSWQAIHEAAEGVRLAYLKHLEISALM